jgi:hypothetical protein
VRGRDQLVIGLVHEHHVGVDRGAIETRFHATVDSAVVPNRRVI